MGVPMDHDAGAAGGALGQLDRPLDDLVRRVGHVTKAVILSQDGMALGASQSLGRDDAEHLAALSAGFQSVSPGCRAALRQRWRVRQTIIEMELGFLLTSAVVAAAWLLLPSRPPTSGLVGTTVPPSSSAGPVSTSGSTRARPR